MAIKVSSRVLRPPSRISDGLATIMSASRSRAAGPIRVAANLLVGNAEGAAVLEAVFMGPELEFSDDAMVAVTGAELPPKLDGDARDTWASFEVSAVKNSPSIS